MKLFVLLFVLSASLFATEMPSSLSSTQANYDGNTLVLTGHVVLDHGLGKMRAEEAHLQRQEPGKEFPFSFIQLKKEVLLSMQLNSQISCGSADLDFTTLKGVFLPEEGSFVVYKDLIQKKRGGESTPFQLQSQRLELNFSKSLKEDKKTEYEVDTILAKEGVVIDYLESFQCLAHEALYRKEATAEMKNSRKEFQGIITAYPKDALSPCQLTHEQDEIFADMIDLDLLHSKISLLHPRGNLMTTIATSSSPMRFKSEYLYWDQNKHCLTLKGNITLEDPSLGYLETQEELLIHHTLIKGKSTFKNLITQGLSTLTYTDPLQHTHKLVTHGPIHLDREKLKATIESPKAEGIVREEKQISYQEDTFLVFADTASIDYSLVEGHLEPSLITLQGNVRLSSCDPQKSPRYSCTDRLSYSVTTRTFILSANPGKKVLFWDESQGMHLSAPEVHITHDPVSHEQHIKGIGAVQFGFTPEEQHTLHRLFPQLKKSL